MGEVVICWRCKHEWDEGVTTCSVCPVCPPVQMTEKGPLSAEERRAFTQTAWYRDCPDHMRWVHRYEEAVAPVKCECGKYYEDFSFHAELMCPDCDK
jgi:hypothetical protein